MYTLDCAQSRGLGSTSFLRIVKLRVSPLLAEREALPLLRTVPALNVVKDIRHGLGPWSGTTADSPALV
jgi:hypothetical protein